MNACIGFMIHVVLAVPQGDSTMSPQEIERWLGHQISGSGRFSPLSRVQSAAESVLAMEGTARVKVWAARARQRAWLPRVDVRFGTDTDIDVRDIGADNERWTEARGLGADVGLRWGLYDLLFSDVELRIHREQRARAALFRLVRERVTDLYFQRLEVALTLRMGGKPTPELLMQAARLDGLLASMTGGQWQRGREPQQRRP